MVRRDIYVCDFTLFNAILTHTVDAVITHTKYEYEEDKSMLTFEAVNSENNIQTRPRFSRWPRQACIVLYCIVLYCIVLYCIGCSKLLESTSQ